MTAYYPKSNKTIADSNFSFAWLEQTLQTSLKTNGNFGANLSVERIGAGQGFLSTLVRITFDWQGTNGEIVDIPKTVVLKIPSMNAMETTLLKLFENNADVGLGRGIDIQTTIVAFEKALHMAHAAEVAFYRFCIDNPTIMPNTHVPKCYYGHNFNHDGTNGILILEDLTRVAAVKPIYQDLSVPAIKQVLDALANIHAYSIENTTWQSDSDMNCSIMKINTLSNGQYENMRRALMVSLKNDYPDYFGKYIDRFLEAFSLNADFAYHLHEEFGIPPVLTHGDLWMNNMLWKRCENNKDETTDELLAIVDWQLVHPGCIGEDFVRLFCSSISPEIRRNQLDDLLKYYHNSLRKALGHEPPFSVNQIKRAYMRLFRFGVMCIVPGFAAFVSNELSNLGSENCAANKHALLSRCKCLLEDFCLSEEII